MFLVCKGRPLIFLRLDPVETQWSRSGLHRR
eukprot:COSAG02_NODE_2994_length_7586_cov_3.858822_10_plen_30_part_01